MYNGPVNEETDMVRIPKEVKAKFEAAGVELPQVFYTVSKPSQYEGEVNVEFNTSAGQYFQRGDNLTDAKQKFFSWFLEMESLKVRKP